MTPHTLALLITLTVSSFAMGIDTEFDAALAQSKLKAREKYPELEDPSSPFFKFVASSTQWLQTNKPWIELKRPSPFESPNWPLVLADYCNERMKQEIADQEKNNAEIAVKSLQQANQMLQLDKLGIIHLHENTRKAVQAYIILNGGEVN